ncbi:MAG: sugar phosphate nucleotidyltransferase [Trueperaceae bacterium]
MSDAAPAAVVLAAGLGKRMRSRLPKVVHEVAGRPMVAHVVRAARAAAVERLVVVVGHGAEAVRTALTHDLPGVPIRFAHQATPLGTGHALACARDALSDHGGSVFVLNGDGPLLRAPTLTALAQRHAGGEAAGRGATLLTTVANEPTGLGRIVRDGDGRFARIVEEKDANEADRAIVETNPGVYLFDASVWERAAALRADNAQGELYVTDLPASYLRDGLPVRTVASDDPDETLAANDRIQLATLERVMRLRIARAHMADGVTMLAPEATFVDDDVRIGRDAVIEPFVMLKRGTIVGEGARVGVGAVLSDCEVAPGAQVPPHTVADGERIGAVRTA